MAGCRSGVIFESFISKSRNKAAAARFMKRALTHHGSPETITHVLRSDEGTVLEIGCGQKSAPKVGNLDPEQGIAPLKRGIIRSWLEVAIHSV